MHIYEIRRFYGEDSGWSMFDASRLTPEVLCYLREENDRLGAVMSAFGYTHLVEIGCGYGRYLDWCLSSGYSYTGIDVVSWLIEVGKMRVAAAQAKYPQLHCSVHVHPAEKLPMTPDRDIWQSPSAKPLAFFPFNCLGNVTQLEPVIAALQDTDIDVFVSTFKTDATSTKMRKAYYGNCGFSRLDSRLMRQGLLITSEQGLHAMAYHPDFLIDAFRKHGYRCCSLDEMATIGAAYHFERVEELKAGGSEQPGLQNRALHAAVYAIMNDPLTSTPDLFEREPLVQFEHLFGPCAVVSTQELVVETENVNLRTGTFVRVFLQIPADAKERAGSGMDLVGTIESAVADCENGERTHLKIRLRQAESKLSRLLGM